MQSRAEAAGSVGVVALAAALLVGPTGAAAQGTGFTFEDFSVETTQSLLDICTVDASTPNQWEAKAFCYGYFQGGADFQEALTAGPNFQPIACPGDEVKVEDAVAVFITFAEANPQYLADRPMDSVFRAAAQAWPCP
jgi:hypothetical protein